MTSVIATATGSDDVGCDVLTAIAARHQMLRRGLKFGDLAQAQTVVASEELRVGLPHGAATVVATPVLVLIRAVA